MWIPTYIQIRNTARVVGSLIVLPTLCGCAIPLAGLNSDLEPWTEDSEHESFADESRSAFEEDDPDLSSRLAARDDTRGAVSAPRPFQWNNAGQSAGNHELQTITIGTGNYRILIVGSLAGHDPSAIELTALLAQHLNDNSIILGGIEATVMRNPNPDGELNHSVNNDDGVRVSRQFDESTVNSSPEAKLIQEMLNQKTFHRVIHVRSHRSQEGLIAANKDAQTAARNVGNWLGMQFVALPGNSLQGTLERWICQSHEADIITFAIPGSADTDTLWEVYGDSLMNLLLEEDFETRELARSRKRLSSAQDDNDPQKTKRRNRRDRPDSTDATPDHAGLSTDRD